MSSQPYPYVRVLRYCLNCDKQIPARSGNYCWEPDCQQAKKARKRANEKAWNAIHKPWLGRNYEHSAKQAHPTEQPAKVKRYCQYKYCHRKKVPLPDGYWRFHPACYQRICEVFGRGLDSAYGVTI